MGKRFFRPLTYKQIAKILGLLGCILIRRKPGSHAQWCNPDCESIFDVPDHGATVIISKTIDYIIKKAKLNKKDFFSKAEEI